jgi:predicted ArsR family transcriptional regulator
MRPDKVNILGKVYTIVYVDRPSDVDIFKRESFWGQIDFWTKTIRVYSQTTGEDVLQTILHEIIHAIVAELKLHILEKEDAHDTVDMLALGLADVFTRNGWLRDWSEMEVR